MVLRNQAYHLNEGALSAMNHHSVGASVTTLSIISSISSTDFIFETHFLAEIRDVTRGSLEHNWTVLKLLHWDCDTWSVDIRSHHYPARMHLISSYSRQCRPRSDCKNPIFSPQLSLTKLAPLPNYDVTENRLFPSAAAAAPVKLYENYENCRLLERLTWILDLWQGPVSYISSWSLGPFFNDVVTIEHTYSCRDIVVSLSW